MHVNGFRVAVLAVVFATLLVGSLVATPTATAAITGSTITTPADLTFFINNDDLPDQTFTISGTTSGGVPATDQVDINCYYNAGTTWHPVASGVPLNADGSFSVSNADLIFLEDGPCQLRAVPAGTNPSDLSPFAGPRVGVGEHYSWPVQGGPNNGQLFSAHLYAEQLTGAFDYTALGGDNGGAWGEIYDGWLYDSTLTNTSVTFYGNAGLLWNGVPTRSELQIDGLNAYPVAAAAVINPSAAGLPALSYSYSLDPATGNLVIHETDPLVECPDPTYPPTSTSCASFVSAGVTDNITITQDHEGRIAWINDVFSSTDGKSHSLDLLWDNHQYFNDNGSQLEYRFPGESGYSLHAAGDTVSLPATPGTILMRVQGAADGDTQTGQGAIVYDRPATGATFTFVGGDSEFTLHQAGTVPAGGSTRFRFAYVQAYQSADVASMAQSATTAFLNKLSVAKAGTGSGTVASSAAGISCGTVCSHGYPYGTKVTLTATPSNGSSFSGWSGACSGTGSCTVTTNDTTSVTAHFGLSPETLSVARAGNGSGTVASSVAGISCGAVCSHGYPYGTKVTLTATPSNGSSFTGWSGACSGTGSCTLTTKGATSVTAHFGLLAETLTVSTAGAGSGTVASSPAGISCGASCSHAYGYGSTVTLRAHADRGSLFTGWSGACSGTGACTVSTRGATSVTAGFSLVPKPVRVVKKGDGKGKVTSSPAGISCGGTCRFDYGYRTSVTLRARAGKGSAFAGWSGACTGTGTCTLKMGSHRTVAARFVNDCLVPKLKGKSLKQAKRTLKAHDCRAGKITHASGKVTKGHVISQKPKPHKQLEHNARIRLVVSNGKAH